jgi:hypothetical protein
MKTSMTIINDSISIIEISQYSMKLKVIISNLILKCNGSSVSNLKAANPSAWQWNLADTNGKLLSARIILANLEEENQWSYWKCQ